RSARDLHVDELIALLDLDRLDAVRPWIGVLAEFCLLDRTILRAEQEVVSIVELSHGHDGLDLRVRRDVDEIDDRLALRRTARLWQLVDLEPEAAAVLREDEQVVVRAPDEEPLDEIELLEVRAT